ncbi:hypothetical protein BJV74DRAFT_848182 [Russula compacta]|nr:hypothetical protein BJV74DRAFT_848182 [Russula compacta]
MLTRVTDLLSNVFTSHSTASLQDPRAHSSPSRRHFQSTGRGGFGNIHACPALGKCASASDGLNNVPTTRDRKHRPPFSPSKVISTGRGGAGNIRALPVVDTRPNRSSPLRAGTKADYECLLVDEAISGAFLNPTGRGGARNVVLRSPYGTILASVSVVRF